MGSSVLGPNDIYVKLKRFKHSLGSRRPKFYFVKVDIRACFDTIEHGKLLDVIEGVLQEVSDCVLKIRIAKTTTQTVNAAEHVHDATVLYSCSDDGKDLEEVSPYRLPQM